MDVGSDDIGEVLVVGAGPVGLVAACELARQGARPRLIDQRTLPDELSRAVLLHARTQEQLAAMGVLEKVQSRARRVTAVEVFTASDHRRPLLRIGLAKLPTRFPCGLDLPQSDTEAMLTERAVELGVRIERGVELTALTQATEGVEVTLQHRDHVEQARFPWVVGADGAHSSVRAAVGTQLSGRFHGQHFVFADVDVDTVLRRDAVLLFAHPDGIAGLFPMAGDRVRLILAVPPPTATAEPTIEEVQRLAEIRFGGGIQLRAARWLAYFEVHHGQVPHYRFGRVLLAGDAAHIHSPAGGQGMNTGIQDAANLAWKLALVSTGRAAARLLDSYETERHPVAAAVIRSTTALTSAMTASGPLGVLRGWAMAAAGHVPRIGESAAQRISEVTISYPRSPIVGRAGGAARPHLPGRPVRLRPGDHAPDVPGLVRPDGSPAWIGDLQQRPGHRVLVRSTDDRAVADLQRELGALGTVTWIVDSAADAADSSLVEVLTDPSGAVARAYGLGSDGFAVIRPDGYVGLLATPADAAALAAYRRRIAC